MQNTNNIYTIHSNQKSMHPKLRCMLKNYSYPDKHLKPIAKNSQNCWEKAFDIIKKEQKPIILDSGCGQGLSSLKLAITHPQNLIIAVDKSTHRLKTLLKKKKPSNLVVVNANMFDIYKLFYVHNINIYKHYMLYPNPWPKKQHIKRRYYAHPLTKLILNLAQTTIIRSNWLLYVQEFQVSANYFGKLTRLEKLNIKNNFMSHFEKKYSLSNTPIFQLYIH